MSGQSEFITDERNSLEFPVGSYFVAKLDSEEQCSHVDYCEPLEDGRIYSVYTSYYADEATSGEVEVREYKHLEVFKSGEQADGFSSTGAVIASFGSMPEAMEYVNRKATNYDPCREGDVFAENKHLVGQRTTDVLRFVHAGADRRRRLPQDAWLKVVPYLDDYGRLEGMATRYSEPTDDGRNYLAVTAYYVEPYNEDDYPGAIKYDLVADCTYSVEAVSTRVETLQLGTFTTVCEAMDHAEELVREYEAKCVERDFYANRKSLFENRLSTPCRMSEVTDCSDDPD